MKISLRNYFVIRVRITYSIITKNHFADRKGFYVGVRLFMKNKRKCHEEGSCTRGSAHLPRDLTTMPTCLD